MPALSLNDVCKIAARKKKGLREIGRKRKGNIKLIQQELKQQQPEAIVLPKEPFTGFNQINHIGKAEHQLFYGKLDQSERKRFKEFEVFCMANSGSNSDSDLRDTLERWVKQFKSNNSGRTPWDKPPERSFNGFHSKPASPLIPHLVQLLVKCLKLEHEQRDKIPGCLQDLLVTRQPARPSLHL